MRIPSRLAFIALGLTTAVFAQSSAFAVSLTEPVSPASFADTALGGTTVAARPELAGAVLEDSLQAFDFQGMTGTVQSRVVREAGGTLDFYWKVSVDESATGTGISALRVANFAYGDLKDADWRMDSLGNVAPTTARLFNKVIYPAGDINFLFGDGIGAGQASYLFFLHTNATSYAKTGMYDLLNVGPQNLSPVFSTFAPAVPEPSTCALLVAGLAMVGVAARRRQA